MQPVTLTGVLEDDPTVVQLNTTYVVGIPRKCSQSCRRYYG